MVELRAKTLRNRFVDSLTTAIGALYLAILSFALVYSYAGIGVYQHQRKLENLITLDKLLALREFTRTDIIPSQRAATERDLPRFFQVAMGEAFDETSKNLERRTGDKERNQESGNNGEQTTQADNPKFPKVEIPDAQVRLDLPMRMSVGATCDALVTKLSPGASFNFATFAIVGGTYWVNSEDVTLLIFFGCDPGPPKELLVLMFRLDDGHFAFAIPESLQDAYPGLRPSLGFKHFPFLELDEVKKRLPLKIADYVEPKGQYVIIHSKAIDYYILSYANYELGKYFPAYKLDDAAQQLYEDRQRDASYLGITAPSVFIVRVGPFLFFILSFELWRRVRRVPSGRLESQRYWFAFETSDVIGQAYSHFLAVLPFLIGTWIYLLFAISQNLGLVLFGRLVTFSGLATWTFPFAPAPGWIATDFLAAIIAFILVPFQFIVLFLIGRKLIQIVRANAQIRAV